jgi:hypothetical protein
MDLRKYSSGGFIKADDVRNGPRQERIVTVYVNEKHDRPVLELESGDQFTLNVTNARTLSKAWGSESDNWRGQTVELSLGHYKDWRTDPPEEKETVVVRAISAQQPTADNGGARPLPAPMSRVSSLDDEVPF